MSYFYVNYLVLVILINYYAFFSTAEGLKICFLPLFQPLKQSCVPVWGFQNIQSLVTVPPKHTEYVLNSVMRLNTIFVTKGTILSVILLLDSVLS